MTFESAHDLWLSCGLELAVETGMRCSWRAGLAVKSAGAAFVSSASSVSHVVFRAFVVLDAQIWPCMMVPACHMFAIYVCRYIACKKSCVQSYYGPTLSTTNM